MPAPTEFAATNAPRAVIDAYDKGRREKLDGGASDDVAHRHGLRMVHNAGWYRGRDGWKRLHDDLRKKINIREAIKQPDGRYVIEDVDVFYPNAAKGPEGRAEAFDAERIGRLVENTNRMIAEGGQRPGLLEGHPPAQLGDPDDDTPELVKLAIGKQFRPMGYAVHFRDNSHGMPGWVKCDLVDVDPEFVERQRHRPLSGLSAGIARDAGRLNERFNHVAALGSSMQALSRLPRTELSEMFSASNVVCFASDMPAYAGPNSKGKPMPMNDDSKKAHEEMADCYSAMSAAFSSYAAGDPDGLNKVSEAKNRLNGLLTSKKSYFGETMPDEALIRQGDDLTGQPSKGPDQIEPGEPEGEHHQEHEGQHFSAQDDPRIKTALEENQKLQSQLAGMIGKMARKDFEAEVDALRRDGRELPASDKLDAMFKLAYSSENPQSGIATVLDMLRAAPKRHSPAGYGTVLGSAGATPAQSAGEAVKPSRASRTAAHQALGVNFSSEDIELGLKIGAAIDGIRSK